MQMSDIAFFQPWKATEWSLRVEDARQAARRTWSPKGIGDDGRVKAEGTPAALREKLHAASLDEVFAKVTS